MGISCASAFTDEFSSWGDLSVPDLFKSSGWTDLRAELTLPNEKLKTRKLANEELENFCRRCFGKN